MTQTLHQSAATIDSNASEEVSVAVVRAVAEAKGVSPLEVTPTLRSAIDPDALDTLVESMPDSADEDEAFVTFPWCGYDVAISADGYVTVSERQ